MDFYQLALKYKEEAIKMLDDVLRFETVLDEFKQESDAPFGQANKNCLEYFIKKAKEDGFVVSNADNYAIDIKLGSGNKLLGILGHLDVVPATGNWDSNPFIPTYKDGKIYARGAIDDKGPVVASYIALKILKDLNIEFKKEVKLILGCDEESGSRCLEHYFKQHKLPDLGFSPDADFPLIYGEKAHLHVKITGKVTNSIIESFHAGKRTNLVIDEACAVLKKDLKEEFYAFLDAKGYQGEVIDNKYITYGISAHAMHPQKGLNACYIMMEFLKTYDNSNVVRFINDKLLHDSFGKKMKIDIYDEDMKELTMNLGVISIEQDNLMLLLDLRVPLDSHEELLREKFTTATLDYQLECSDFTFQKRHYVSKDSNLVKTLMDSYVKYTNDYENKPFTIGGGTYAKFIPNAVAFGPLFPNREDVVHQVNEYIIIEDFIKCISIYADAIYRLVVQCD